jgi:hypothetical protein
MQLPYLIARNYLHSFLEKKMTLSPPIFIAIFPNLFITYRPPTYMFITQDSFKFEVCDLDTCSVKSGTVTIKFIEEE